MAIFLHPFLTRGVVRLPNGAFPITRGRVELPDDVGEPLGWRKIEDDDSAEPQAAARPRSSAGSSINQS
jgi:hypothetical protein